MEHSNLLYQETCRVPAYECDPGGNLKPAGFFRLMTEAAVLHAELLGAGFEVLRTRNLFWVNSRMKVQFLRYPRMGETVTLRTWPKTIQQKLFFIRDFELVDADGARLAGATSAWLVIDAVSRRMVPSQTASIDLPGQPERIGLDEPLERLGLAHDGEERLRRTANYSALDPMGHVNNSRYIEWICDALPQERLTAGKLDWLQINYDHETRPGEELCVKSNPVAADPTLWALEGVNQTDGLRAFEAAVRWKD
jgi:acyl-ACP thioesterase